MQLVTSHVTFLTPAGAMPVPQRTTTAAKAQAALHQSRALPSSEWQHWPAGHEADTPTGQTGHTGWTTPLPLLGWETPKHHTVDDIRTYILCYLFSYMSGHENQFIVMK